MTNGLDEYLDQIKENWYEAEGPCEQCPARDQDGQWSPVFGRGDKNADVVCIGIDPGGNAKPKRDRRDYGETKWATKNQSHSRNSALPPVNEKRDAFFNQLDCYSEGEPSECGVYFTNLKKCNEVHDSKWQKSYRKAAKYCCTSYTVGELNRLSPKVVVSFKAPVLEWLLDHYYAVDYSENIHTTADIVLESTWEADGVTIVPSYHFSGAPRGTALNALTSRGKISQKTTHPQNEYWSKLAKQINSILSESDLS